MRLLRAVVRSEGVTALVATHDPVLIELADEVLQLEDGKIAAPVAGDRSGTVVASAIGRAAHPGTRGAERGQATVVPVLAVRLA